MQKNKNIKIEHECFPIWIFPYLIFIFTPAIILVSLRLGCIFGCSPVIISQASVSTTNSYSIEYDFRGEIPPTVIQGYIVDAIELWKSYLINSTTTFELPSGTYCGNELTLTSPVDVKGLIIYFRYEEILTPGVLGQAGPCILVDDIPRMGIVILDKSYMQELTVYPHVIIEIIAHEIGHVLGIGSLWQPGVDYIESTLDELPGYPYIHDYANIEHISYGGNGVYARVEDSGGGGTRGGHWDEEVYDNELMTGYVESGDAHNHLSRISLGGLKDLGYIVNMSLATSLVYEIPSISRRRLRQNKKRYEYNQCLKFNITKF
jgi:hypothetical protein